MINEINSVSNLDSEIVIKLAAYFYNVLEQIHPFSDGNGRVGRTIANYILMTNDMPLLIIYNEDKKYYYSALEKFDIEEDLNSMIEFFKYEMGKTWEMKLNREAQ